MHFHSGQVDEATHLVKRFHYSGRMTFPWFVGTAHLDGGLFGDFGPAIAAAVWSQPPARWSEDVIELTRLVRADNADVHLTQLISWCISQMRQRDNAPDLLVSFADVREGHHGGIYQACSWFYHGMRSPRMDAIWVNQRKVPARTCNAYWGTSSPEKLSEKLGVECRGVYDEGKHLYWKPITKSGRYKAKRLGLLDTPYPKPEQQEAA